MGERESLTMEDPTRNVDGVQLRRELRRAAVWAALALAALVGIYYVLLVPFMDPLDPRASIQTETSYKNRALDVCYTLPEDWEFMGEEQLEAVTQQILGVANGAKGGQMMMAYKPGSALNVQLQCTGGYRNQKLDGESLRAVIDRKLYMLPEGAQSEWLEPVRLGKLTYEQFRVRYSAMGLDWEQYALVGGHGDYVAIIFLTGQTSEHPGELLSDFS